MQNAKPITRNISVISIISLYENVQKYYITHINPITPIIPQKKYATTQGNILFVYKSFL